ncbi:MAG: hypothetical protein AB8C95_04915 [Phycisphaeraceae bacterium]
MGLTQPPRHHAGGRIFEDRSIALIAKPNRHCLAIPPPGRGPAAKESAEDEK